MHSCSSVIRTEPDVKHIYIIPPDSFGRSRTAVSPAFWPDFVLTFKFVSVVGRCFTVSLQSKGKITGTALLLYEIGSRLVLAPTLLMRERGLIK